MMLQPTPEMKELIEKMNQTTNQEEFDKLREEYVKLLLEREKALEDIPFAH